MLSTDSPLGLIPMKMWAGLDNFAWVAIPFFILAGELMSSGGILERLFEFARLCVGHFRGGLLHVNIMASMLFGGINGSAVADTSAVGSMMIPVTIKEYNDPPLAAAVTACSSIVGPIIPPSLPFILYALTAKNVTISGMFMAGVVPGVLLGVGMMVVTHFMIKKRNYPVLDIKYTLNDAVKICLNFLVALILPVIMVGGVVSGIFTATESSCAAVLYALFVGVFVTKKLGFKEIYQCIIRASKMTSIVMLFVAVANASIWWLTTQNLPYFVQTFLTSLTTVPFILLLITAITYIVLGFFLDSAALIVLLVPITVPICVQYGLHPLHIGLVTVMAIMYSLMTPPVSMGLFIASAISNVPVEKVFRTGLPLILYCVFVLLLVLFFPEIWIWVPKLTGTY